MAERDAPTERDAAALLLGQSQVLIVSHGFQKNYERGFCNGLRDAGFEFLLVSSDQTDYAGLGSGVKTLNLRRSQDERRPRWRKLLNLVRYHLALMTWVAIRRPQVIHVIGMIEPPWLCGIVQGLWFRLWAVRYVLTVHDVEPHDRGNPRNRRLYAWSFALADHLVVHTARLRDELAQSLGRLPASIVVMEHGIEPVLAESEKCQTTVHAKRCVATRAAPMASEPLKLLVFGYVHRYKGIDLLLEALRGYSGAFRLRIAGRAVDPVLRSELLAALAAHPHKDWIEWQDAFLPESAIEPLFLDSDVLVLAYRRIDQSGVLFQALRHGLPVLATRVGAFEDYVGNEVGELCLPGDVTSLREGLERIAARRAEFDRLAIAVAARRFEWSRTVEALGACYGVLPPTNTRRPRHS